MLPLVFKKTKTSVLSNTLSLTCVESSEKLMFHCWSIDQSFIFSMPFGIDLCLKPLVVVITNTFKSSWEYVLGDRARKHKTINDHLARIRLCLLVFIET